MVPTRAALAVLCVALLVAEAVEGFISLPGGGGDGSGEKPTRQKGNRRLAPGVMFEEGHLRADPKRERANFDPEVAVHEEEADLEYMGYDEEYTNEEYNEDYWDRFNVTERIHEIFPQIDSDKDGYLVMQELHFWQHQNAKNATLRRSERTFNATDEDKDERISLREYLNEDDHKFIDMEQPAVDGEDEELELDLRDWKHVQGTKEKFRLADTNGDGFLQLMEYHSFAHPEECENRGLHEHTAMEDIADNDRDNDGRLSLDEFTDHLWHYFYSWEDEENDGWDEEADLAQAKDKFRVMDANQDGYITHKEIMPFFFEIHPTNGHFAQIQARDVMSDADEDEDRRLSLQEMLDNSHVFYHLSEDHDRHHYYDYYDHYYHDEF